MFLGIIISKNFETHQYNIKIQFISYSVSFLFIFIIPVISIYILSTLFIYFFLSTALFLVNICGKNK